MTFVSYAQNFEDVLLWRALKGVAAGFYIDVGASNPDADSVTRAFYDRGWRGVNVEPSPAAFARLAAARLRDVNLPCAVGASAGEAVLFDVPGTGLSTLDPEAQARAAASGFTGDAVPVALRTLADICRAHAPAEVHFLKIDVEGAEAAVLQGADFAACRPWVVLVEATAPMSTEPAHAGWEPLLLAAGYRFAWFDGLNRFYLAAERHAALSPAFATPPNVFDDFIRAADSDLARRIGEAERSLAGAQAEAALAATRAGSSARRLLDAVRATGAARALAAEREQALAWTRGLLDAAQTLERGLRAEGEWRRGQLEAATQLAEERGAHIVAKIEELAWLRGCMAADAAALDAVRQGRDAMERRLADLERRLPDLEWRLADTGRRLEAERARAGQAEAAHAAAAAQARRAAAEAATLRGSLSWRLTAPLRRVRQAWGRPAAVPLPATPEPSTMAEPALSVPALPSSPAPAPPAPVPPTAALVPSPPSMPAPPALPDPTQPPAPDAPPTPVVPETPGHDPSPPTASPALPLPLPAPSLPHALPLPDPSPPPGPVHAVHQFHSGSAVGDAITNAMLMLRGVLRGMGYASDIFVEHCGEGLEHELHTLDALPRHAGYVLLAHHSMGYGAFDRILALPARKVLIYHNITPPEFLGHMPGMQQAARTGREQLAAWRGHAAAALADSEYNAAELRSLGFAAARQCTLLFDLDALRRRAAAASLLPRGPAVFTALFVGRITPSKAQDDLLAAFSAFCVRYPLPCRLVLLGAFDPAQSGYLDHLDEVILDHGLSERVLLTGLVPDEELAAWYARADLYVSLSHHEGFGVPLVEAMAQGVPVLAWPAGAVPYTLGGTAELLTSRDPAIVAGRMLALAHDPARRAAIAARQSAGLDRFALAGQAALLRDALALAGAQLPPDAAAHAALAANMRLAVSGHVNKTYSLAAVNRAIAAAFEAQRPGAVRLLPVEGEPTDRLDEVPAEGRALVASLAARPAPVTGPELVLSQHYPVHVPQHRGDLLAAMVFWEESLLPAAAVAALNSGFDAVLAPSAFVARALVDSGVAVPVATIGHAPPLGAFAALAERPARTPFTFLHVSSAFPRKGVDVLLAAWRQAFRASDPVRLVLKAFPNPHNDAAAQIARLQAEDPDAAPVSLVDADLDEAALCALYAEADAMALPSRGEGYNLPAAEAMAAGLPLIVTDVGGHRDFCGPGTARLVRSRPAPAGSHLAAPHALWREPDAADLADALREAAAGVPPGQAAAARAAIAAHADPSRYVERLSAAAAALILARPVPPARIAWVSSWGVRCGVASYSRALLDALPREGVGDLAILCDDRMPGSDGVHPCWDIDKPVGHARLVDAVSAADADVVMVQHQPALLPWDTLAGALAALAAQGRAVVATLHNTAHLLGRPDAERDRAAAALAGIARVLVHTLADVARLEALGVTATLLPHAAPPPAAPRPTRALPPGSAPVVGCYGFFLPGKGIGVLIEAVAALRAQWPGIRLRLVNAAYGHADSAAEIASCQALAAACGLAVEWRLDYLPDAGSLALLAECDLLALPYAPSLESSSAALRITLASGVPVAVSPIALFDEAADAVARLPGGGAADVAAGLAALLADAERRAALGAAAQGWLANHAAGPIASRLAGMLRGLAAQRHLGIPYDGTVWTPPQSL